MQASWYGLSAAPAGHPTFNTRSGVIHSDDHGCPPPPPLQIWCLASRRLADTWSSPVWFEESPIASFYQRAYTEPLRLPDGALLYPTYCSRGQTRRRLHFLLSDSFGVGQRRRAFVPHGCMRWVGAGGFDAGEGKLVGAIQRSDDEGETWRLSATIERPDGAAPNRPLACALAPAEK